MFSILLLGFLIGMQHALEADHLAAVASMASRSTSARGMIRHGTVWGLGHSLTLMAFAVAALLLNWTLGEALGYWLEFAVGAMLALLGGHVLYRLVKDRIHFHSHRHGEGVVHFHAHSHAGESVAHDRSQHRHNHDNGLPMRTFIVGIMHGMAGSAALLILSASAFQDPYLGLIYVGLFGLGSVIGMAVLSALIAIPFRYSARCLTWANRSLRGLVGSATLALGLYLMLEIGPNLSTSF